MKDCTRERIRELISEAIADGVTAGAAILIREQGEETFFDVQGRANIERNEALRRDHIHRLYSMTKPVTSAAAMILIERGLLDPGTPVKEVLPGYGEDYLLAGQKMVPSPVPVTVHHLLNMTSGLTYGGMENTAEIRTTQLMYECEKRMRAGDAVSTMEFASMVGKLPLAFEPDTSWQYGLSADVLGAVIEAVSGKRFGDFLESELFGPLGMKDTGFYVPPEKQSRLADVYQSAGNGKMKPFRGDNLLLFYQRKERPDFESGGAGLVSTIDDYSRFAQMLLNGGELDGVRILRPRTVAYMTSGNLTPVQERAFHRRFGLYGFTYSHLMRQMRDSGSYTTPGRNGEYGWDSWTGCYAACFPEENMSMVFLEQKAECGTIPLVRKIRSVWLTE